MQPVDLVEAAANLSRLIAAVETGAEPEVILTRDGIAVARIVAVSTRRVGQRIGVAEGRFTAPESIDADNKLIEGLFNGTIE